MSEFLFGPVPHEEAMKTIAGKPVVSRQVFDEMLPELRARAFVITGIEAANVAQTVRDRIAELPAGADWDKIKKEIVNDISPHLVDPSADAEEQARQLAASERRAELLLRTHGFQAYQAAQYNVMDRQRDVFPFWQYLTMGDDHVRDSHKALNGVVLPANHPFWQDHYPPWDFGCRCQVVPLSEDDAADVRAADAGRPPEARELIEGAQLEKLEQNGTLFRSLSGGAAQNFDVRSPLAKAATADDKQRAFRWHPGDLRLDVEQLKARYDAPVWASFEKFAKGQELADGRTVMEWLDGKKAEGRKSKAEGAVERVPFAPKPEPETPTEQAPQIPPRQSPASTAMSFVGSGAAMAQARLASKLIDFVHDDGRLPLIGVNLSEVQATSGEYVVGVISGRPMAINLKASGPHPALTFVHETGHLLDHQALGTPGTFASRTHPDLAAWRAAVDASSGVKDLRRLLVSATNEDLREALSYYLKPEEIFARAYAQFVATRSGSGLLARQLALYDKESGTARLLFWDEREFKPIAAALEQVFRKRGWIR